MAAGAVVQATAASGLRSTILRYNIFVFNNHFDSRTHSFINYPKFIGELTPLEESELNAFEKARKKQCLGRGLIQQLPIYPDNRKLYCHQVGNKFNKKL
jgi:hypothetical protein